MVIKKSVNRTIKNLTQHFALAGFVTLFSVAAAAPAFSEETGFGPNAPRSPWIVGPIQALTSSPITYCSMKTKYTGGHTLIFARDATGSNSLAFDFGKKELKTGKQYPLRIDLGFLTRNLVAVAAASDVLIVQMGRDEPFYNMLSRKSEMRVVIEGHENFYGLEGADDALKFLSECAAAQGEKKEFIPREVALKPTAEASAMSSSTAGAVDPKSSPSAEPQKDNMVRQSLEDSMQEEIEILRAQNRKLLLENQKIAASAATAHIGVSGISVTQLSSSGPPVIAAPAPVVESSPMAAPQPIVLKTMDDAKPVQQKAAFTGKMPKKPLPPPARTVKAKTPVTAPVVSKAAKSDRLVVDIVKASGVAMQNTPSGYYVWASGHVSGRLQSFPMASDETLAAATERYMKAAASICDGDYAHNVSENGQVANYITAESACVEAADSTGTSLVIVAGDDDMSVISLQAPTDYMQETLDARQALISKLVQKK